MNYFDKEQLHIFLFEDLVNDPVGTCKKLFKIVRVEEKFTPEVNNIENHASMARFPLLSKVLESDRPFKRYLVRRVPYLFVEVIKSKIERLNEKELLVPPMDIRTRKELVAYFEEHNEKLANLIGRDLSHWNNL
jgi:hypothetical protein